MKCDCPSPALCRRLGRHVRGYLWQLWNTRADYRALWEREAAARTPPPWWRRAWNFLRALVPHAGRGFPRASWWVRTRRRDVCRGCPHYNLVQDSCGHKACGCKLGRKIAWADAKCPLGKWAGA